MSANPVTLPLRVIQAIRTEYKWRVLAVTALYNVSAAGEILTWPVLLPIIARHFDVGPAQVAWLVVCFSLGMAGSVLTVGHLGDQVGHRRLLLTGIALEVTFLAVAALTPWLIVMCGLRFLQGVAHAMVLGNLQAVTQVNFTPEERGRSLGINMMSPPIGAMLGPVYGGVAAAVIGWQAALIGLSMLLFTSLVALYLTVREDASHEATIAQALRKLDWPGAVLLLATIGSLIVAGLLISKDASRATGVLVLGVFVVGCVSLFLIERRTAHPVLDLTLFSKRSFAAATAGLIFFSAIIGSSNFLFPFYLQEGLGRTSAAAGGLIVFGSILAPFANPISGVLTDRFGARYIQIFGISLTATGFFLASNLGSSPERLSIIAVLMVIGLGGNFFSPPNSQIIMNSAPIRSLGTASSITASGRYIGMSLGAAIVGASLTAQESSGVVTAFGDAMATLTVVLLIGMIGILGGPSFYAWIRSRKKETVERAADSHVSP